MKRYTCGNLILGRMCGTSVGRWQTCPACGWSIRRELLARFLTALRPTR